MRIFMLALVAASLAACAVRTTGNAQGGVTDDPDEQSAFRVAQAHCEKYGKDARITQIVPFGGGSSFSCLPR